MSDIQDITKYSFCTDDFNELQDASAQWDQQYTRLEPGHFEGRMDLTQVGSTHIFRETWSRKLRYAGTTPAHCYAFALPIEQVGLSNWVGSSVCLDTAIIQTPNKEADFVSSGFFDMLVLAVPEDDVQSIVSALTDQIDLGVGLNGTATLENDNANQLRLIGLDFLSLSPLDDPIMTRFWSEQLVRLFLWEIVKTRENLDLIDKPAKSFKLVTQATDFMLSAPEDRIGLTEVCVECDVSLRTLHYAFRDVTGMSPATWLRRLRLNKVHKTLLKASPDDVQIKGAALEQGFVHLGHFGQQYRRLFGCTPSETLYAS